MDHPYYTPYTDGSESHMPGNTFNELPFVSSGYQPRSSAASYSAPMVCEQIVLYNDEWDIL